MKFVGPLEVSLGEDHVSANKQSWRKRCQAVGTLPATLAALAVHSAERNEAGVLDPGAGQKVTTIDTVSRTCDERR